MRYSYAVRLVKCVTTITQPAVNAKIDSGSLRGHIGLQESRMNATGIPDRHAVIHIMLAPPLTEGIVVRRMLLDGAPVIASNVPLLRHHSHTGFDFGNAGGGSSDLALACVQAVLERLDYIGPTDILWDGSRVYRLAVTLHAGFRARFVEPARAEELRISWTKAMTWVRQALLERVRRENITLDALFTAWRQSAEALPDKAPPAELDRAELTRQLHEDLVALAGQAGALAPFLGMVA